MHEYALILVFLSKLIKIAAKYFQPTMVMLYQFILHDTRTKFDEIEFKKLIYSKLSGGGNVVGDGVALISIGAH